MIIPLIGVCYTWPMPISSEIRRGRSVVSALHVHLVFVTKYRRGALTDPMLDSCEQAMAKVCSDFGANLREFNGEDDHVHLLIDYPVTVQLSTLVNSLKGVSSRMLGKEFPEQVRRFLWGGHFWSPSYFAASCGGAPLGVVAEYVRNQKRPL